MAVSTGDVVRVILPFYLMPAWTVLLAWRFLGERPTRAGVLRLVLAFSGMALVIVPQGASMRSLTAGIGLPEVLAVLGGFCFSCTNVVLRRSFHMPSMSRVLAMFVGCVVVGLATAGSGYGLGHFPAVPAPDAVWVSCLLGMAVMVAIGSWALQYGAARVPTSTTSLIMLSEVLFASISAWLLGATELTSRMLLGGALIITGALLAVLQGRTLAVSALRKHPGLVSLRCGGLLSGSRLGRLLAGVETIAHACDQNHQGQRENQPRVLQD